MKKTKNIVVALVAVLAMAFSAIAFAACGSDKDKTTNVNGTYTLTLSAEDCSGNFFSNGYLANAGAYQVNTLVLEDGKYTLTKFVTSGDNKNTEVDPPIAYDVNHTMIFTGTYTNEGSTVTLSAAETCDYDLQWGLYTMVGFVNAKGSTANGDKITTGDKEIDPLTFFATAYFNTNGNEETVVEVSGNTFTYVKAASSDDD